MKEIDEMYVHKFRTPELMVVDEQELEDCLLYTSPSPRDTR